MRSWLSRPGVGIAVVVVAVLIVASCGGSSSGQSPEQVESSDGSVATAAVIPSDTVSPAVAASESGEPKTLDEYLGAAANFVRGPGGGGGNFDEDQALEQQRLVQQEIQICMQAQGFVYVPEEAGDGLRFFLASGSSGQTDAQYAETQGFGISTRFDSILEGDVDLTETTSPNDEHLATLSEGEADAWQFALRGAPPERNDAGQLVDPETGEPVQGRGASGGCTGDAQEAVRGDFSSLADLAQDFEELEVRIAADPRMAEIARSWTDCMRTEGFDYQDEAEARDEINTEFRPLLRSFFQQTIGEDQAQGQGQGRQNPLQAISGVELTPDQEFELQTLQANERAVATASVVCQGDTDAEVAEIEAIYEAEFIEANRAALESLSS